MASLAFAQLPDFILRRLDPLGWPVRGMVRVHRDGPAVAAALVERLARFSAGRAQRLLLVAGWHPGAESGLLDPVRASAHAHGVELLDLEPVLAREVEARGGDWSQLFHVAPAFGGKAGHMTPLTNDRVAIAIAERLRAFIDTGR
jgi:hypothetical protein